MEVQIAPVGTQPGGPVESARDEGYGEATASLGANAPRSKPKQRSRRRAAQNEEDDSTKRRCVSTACIACRKRKSKCDGNTPACAACSQVYGTECIYDPNSDHRRKGVYKNDIDSLKTRHSTLQTLIHSILNLPEEEIPALIREIRTCESLDDVAERLVAEEEGVQVQVRTKEAAGEIVISTSSVVTADVDSQTSPFESTLYGKMGDLRIDDGSVRYIGGTSNLIHVGEESDASLNGDEYQQQDNPVTSWSLVTDDSDLVLHLLNMYFTWHYTFFTTLSKTLFERDFRLGKPPDNVKRKTQYCTPLLVNAMLALGCHFTSHPGARDTPTDSATAGDHFFNEAKRLLMEHDEHEKPRLTTVQALALMSVREAGCGREARGWVYSGMSFRMSCDMGLNLDTGMITSNRSVNGDEAEEDVRRITFWGCFLFDKCWSNYLGRLPQLPRSTVTVPKFEVFPDEDSASWLPYTDSGFTEANSQPARTRAVALQISLLCEISNDLMQNFYDPTDLDKSTTKQIELKKLGDIHTRLETWRRELPKELEPKEGGLSSVLVMHMFSQLLFIHLFRPFLKYTKSTSPLPANVSPRKLCTQAAAMISKLLRLYKRSHGLRQICNIAVYIAHSACTIHLLNLPDKNARRDIIHGVKHLEEIAEGWPCARRTLGILSLLARRWNVELPEEAEIILARTDGKFGPYKREAQSPSSEPTLTQASKGFHQNVQSAVLSTAIPQSSAQMLPMIPNGLNRNAAATARLIQPPGSAMRPAASEYRSAPQEVPQPVRSGPQLNRMFGGIEQLLRDSQDWAYRDQAQFATGFGNWNGVEDDSSSWMNAAVMNNGLMTAGSSAGIPISAPPSINTAASITSSSPVFTSGVTGATSVQSVTAWANNLTPYDPVLNYDESEWYM